MAAPGLLLLLLLAAGPPPAVAPASVPSGAPAAAPVLLDRVVALVDSDPILLSEVERVVALGLVPERELLAILETHAHRSRHRPEHADPQPSLLEVLAQQVVRLLVATLDERGDGAGHLVVRGGSHGVPPVGAS